MAEHNRQPTHTIVLPDTEEYDMHELTLWANFGPERINVVRSPHVTGDQGYVINNEAMELPKFAPWRFTR